MIINDNRNDNDQISEYLNHNVEIISDYFRMLCIILYIIKYACHFLLHFH